MNPEQGTPDSSGGPPSAGPTSGRFAQWWAGWRVALRVARRDARRYKWRSALIVVMVGLPVMLLTSGITLLATNDISLAESIPSTMGSAQARVRVAEPIRQTQSPDAQSQAPDAQSQGSSQIGTGGKGASRALAVPGFAPDSRWTPAKIQKLTSGRVIPTLDASVRVTLGDRRPRMSTLGIDARDPVARGMADLVSGRWASTNSEIVVTEAGIEAGLPREGRVMTTGSDGKPRLLRVVGVATAQTQNGNRPLLVALPDLVADISDQAGGVPDFLVARADSVAWSDVRRINDYGLLVQSREVFLNLPPDSEVDPALAQTLNSDQRQVDLVLLLAGLGLFIETTLLAGPAFAVSAARQRRSLALAASNGAAARQLRRYVLGQAVVLGAASATFTVVAGVLLTLAGLTWWQAGHADFASGPFEVSWPRVLGVFICAVVASMVAALLPARGVARLDIVSVLAGRAGDRTVHRGLPVAGVILMVVSGFGLIGAVVVGGGEGVARQGSFMIASAIGLVVGCLMVIPAALVLVGRLGTHLVLPMRLATRDTARQRGRSTPAVAAIMAAVAALTALSIGAASKTRQQEDAYEPQRPMGTGVIVINGEDTSERSVRAVLDRYAPQLTVDREAYVAYAGPPTIASDRTVTWVSPVSPACTETQVLLIEKSSSDVSACRLLSDGIPQVSVGGLSSLPAGLRLSKTARSVLASGGVLVTDPRFVRDGKVSYVAGTSEQGRSEGSSGHEIIQRLRLPAVVLDPKVWEAVFHEPPPDAWIEDATASRLGWPLRVTSFNLNSPNGTISADTERAVADRLGDGYILYVERGFQTSSGLLLLIAFSVTGFLVLIASLISTALSLAEGQNDMATLAAVGATRHTRRGIAACQAFVVAGCGALLGVGVGFIPGIAVTWPLTVGNVSDQLVEDTQGRIHAIAALPRPGPVIEIPWLPLFSIVVLVPLMAAGLAWLAVRRHPQMTRREA